MLTNGEVDDSSVSESSSSSSDESNSFLLNRVGWKLLFMGKMIREIKSPTKEMENQLHEVSNWVEETYSNLHAYQNQTRKQAPAKTGNNRLFPPIESDAVNRQMPGDRVRLWLDKMEAEDGREGSRVCERSDDPVFKETESGNCADMAEIANRVGTAWQDCALASSQSLMTKTGHKRVLPDDERFAQHVEGEKSEKEEGDEGGTSDAGIGRNRIGTVPQCRICDSLSLRSRFHCTDQELEDARVRIESGRKKFKKALTNGFADPTPSPHGTIGIRNKVSMLRNPSENFREGSTDSQKCAALPGGGKERFSQPLSQHGLESRNAISGSSSRLGYMFPRVTLTSARNSNAGTTPRKSVLPNVGSFDEDAEGSEKGEDAESIQMESFSVPTTPGHQPPPGDISMTSLDVPQSLEPLDRDSLPLLDHTGVDSVRLSQSNPASFAGMTLTTRELAERLSLEPLESPSNIVEALENLSQASAEVTLGEVPVIQVTPASQSPISRTSSPTLAFSAIIFPQLATSSTVSQGFQVSSKEKLDMSFPDNCYFPTNSRENKFLNFIAQKAAQAVDEC